MLLLSSFPSAQNPQLFYKDTIEGVSFASSTTRQGLPCVYSGFLVYNEKRNEVRMYNTVQCFQKNSPKNSCQPRCSGDFAMTSQLPLLHFKTFSILFKSRMFRKSETSPDCWLPDGSSFEVLRTTWLILPSWIQLVGLFPLPSSSQILLRFDKNP